MTGTDEGWLRKMSDVRFGQAWVPCPDCHTILLPTGDAYGSDEGRTWTLGFRCPNHADELLRIWGAELQPLIDEVLAGVDIAALPWVDAALRPVPSPSDG